MAKRDDEQHPCVKEVSKAVEQVQSDCYSKAGQRLLPTCHTYKLLERMILNRLNPIKEQAGFRAGKSCTSQLLNLTQYMLLLLFAMIRSVVKSFKVPDVDVVAALMSNESALTRMTDSTPKNPWSDLTLVLDG